MQKHIINLGKALLKELGLDPGVDTLARWMAHYVAEQMEIAENLTDDDKSHAEQRCFETILKLWQHRSSLPNGRRPLENFEPIFRTLERLNPENIRSYYFNEPSEPSKIDDSVQKWLDIASGIDQVVRIWLAYVFKQAALCATDEKTIAWLENSFDLNENDDVLTIIHLLPDIISKSDEMPDERIKQEKIELLNNKIKKLEEFSEFNQKLILIIRKEIEDTSG